MQLDARSIESDLSERDGETAMQKRIFLLVAMWMFPVGVLAQTSTPPVKMGLWQTSQTSTVSGIGQLHTIVMQSCFTPEGWTNFFKSMQRDDHCTFIHMKQTSTSLTADVACRSSDSNSTGHFDVSFVSPEKMRGKAHGQVVSQMHPEPMVFDTKFESTYLGADCKGVSPDSAKIIR